MDDLFYLESSLVLKKDEEIVQELKTQPKEEALQN
jgi:hypothetical protein